MAGKRIITTFAETSITFLLPELEAGIFDDNWRIRLSSVQLLGDLLFHLSGVTGKMSATGADDENYGTSEGFKVRSAPHHSLHPCLLLPGNCYHLGKRAS